MSAGASDVPGDLGNPNPLGDFLDSLKRIGEGTYRLGLPAHGEPFLDPASHVGRPCRPTTSLAAHLCAAVSPWLISFVTFVAFVVS